MQYHERILEKVLRQHVASPVTSSNNTSIEKDPIT